MTAATLAAMVAIAAGASPCNLVLTRDAPTGACAIPSQALAVAEVRVTPVDNVAHVPVNIRITFAPAMGETRALLPVSLYPADRGGTFLVPLPHQDGRLVFTLISGSRPLTVRIGPITWRELPP